MTVKPVAIGACGALAGDKFRVTATRYEPGQAEEIIAQEDYPDTSMDNMTAIMEGLSRGIVIPKQQQVNSASGHNTKSAIITGWAPGNFFTGLDRVINKYPLSKEVRNHFGKERDSGYVQQGVHKAYTDSGMSFDDYISACRAVHPNPTGVKDVQKDIEWSNWILNHMRNYSNGDEAGKKSLKELQNFIYNKGKQVVESLREYSLANDNGAAFERMTRYDPDDPTVGNRFSAVSLAQYGQAGKRLIKLPGIRKAYADGMRDEMGFPRNKDGDHVHVLCPKVIEKDIGDRPLTNVAGAILNQGFIRDGHMTINDLRDPYA